MQGRSHAWLWEWPLLIVLAVVLSLGIKAFVVQAFYIPSGSMENTLAIGDRIVADKITYLTRNPERGDIVVFKIPDTWENPGAVGEQDFVKRVIAAGGQVVACCDPHGRVTVDGRGLEEPYIYQNSPLNAGRTFGAVRVPEGRLWVMGDHRSASADSREHVGDRFSGTIAVDDVIGRADVIVWPLDRARWTDK